ncbi:hypothetical protein Tco_1132802 [Tanacetum coccineum]|uniref:Uncharacterized protein n=1 Tax=Tanacetum coccineum TaxID=301880 RepID=A0ABQ5JCZ3_9ASTR
MHNNIMAAGSRNRPPMLAMRRYAQWQSCFLKCIDTRPNGDALRKFILEGPYQPTSVIIPAVPATDDSPEKEAIHLLLTGIGDEIYSTVDACKTAHYMWIAIERLQHDDERNDKKQLNSFYDAIQCLVSSTTSTRMVKYQKNEICAERIAKNANPLALVDAAQQYPDPYYQAPKFHKSFATPSKQASSKRSTNLPTTTSELLQTPETRMKPKKVKDYTYHKEKMLMCKQAKKGIPLQAEQADWLEDTDEEIDEQELEAHCSYMAKIYEVLTIDSGTDTEPLEQDDSNVTPDSPDMCDNDIQTDQNAKDERAVLANLIANLKLDVDENKKIQK